jgi:hypothetical protein
MVQYRDVRCFEDIFDRSQVLTTTSGMNGWAIADTSSAGTPTYTTVNGGGLTATLASTSEVENVCIYQKDILTFDINELQFIEMLVKVGSISSATSLAFGLAGARSDTLDSVAQNCWFRMEGGTSTSNVVVETDDGTTDNDDVATGATLSTTLKLFRIEFFAGVSDIRFFIDNARVASGTTFSMSAYTGALQPFIQLQKTAATSTPSVTIAKVKIQYSKAYA